MAKDFLNIYANVNTEVLVPKADMLSENHQQACDEYKEYEKV
jgi:hypothetical protein